MAFIHPRTGRSWATEAMAIQMDGPLVSPAPIGPGQTGTLVQTGAFAGNASGWIEPLQVNYGSPGPQTVDQFLSGSEGQNTSPTNYGTALNPSLGLQAAQDAWDAVLQGNPNAGNWSASKGSLEDWNTYYRSVSGPIGAADILQKTQDTVMPTLQQAINQLTGGGVTVNTPTASAGSATNPGTGNGGQAKNTASTPATNAGTGIGGAIGGALDKITDTAGEYGIYIIGGIIALVFVILLMGRGSSQPVVVKA